MILRTVKPSGNKQKGKFAKSEDLRSRFRRDMRQSFDAEVNGMFEEPRLVRRKAVTPKADGRAPVLAAYVSNPIPLRAHFKGKIIKAQVRRDGTIRYAGKIFNSPSHAAAAACNRPTCNGWGFWTYERAPGDWVTLNALRA